MTSGQQHDKATTMLCVPFSIFIGLFLGLSSGVLAGISFIFGGFWLSPDLDIHSQSLKRWGYLQFLWWPYRKLIPHRSFLSHGPLIGTAIRIAYLITIGFLLKIFFHLLGIKLWFLSLNQLKSFSEIYHQQILAIIIGVEGSVWLHLILDGDPLLINWKKSKK